MTQVKPRHVIAAQVGLPEFDCVTIGKWKCVCRPVGAPGAVQFSVGHFEREGPIYAAEQRGRTIYIEWNADHPFYQKVILANRDNRDVINAVNARVFSMAAAELRSSADADQNLMEGRKSFVSANLRTLFS